MKILVLSPGRNAEGGAERSATLLVQGLVQRGHEVSVLGIEGSATAEFAAVGARTRLFPETTSHGKPMRHAGSAAILVGAARSLPSTASAAYTLRTEIRNFDPDVVYSNGARTHLLAAATPTRVPIVWALRDVPPRSLHRRLLRAGSRRCSLILANSSFTAEYLKPTPVPIEVVGNPVAAIEREDRAEVAARLQLPASRQVVAMVAHLHESKGHHVMIDALAGWPGEDRPLLVIAGGRNYPGSDSYEQSLREQAAALGIAEDVVFLGNVRNIADVYSVADVLAHPAVHPEGFGRTIVEAQSAGVPVVATGLGGVVELCSDGTNALLVGPGDPTALSAALHTVLNDEGVRMRLVTSGIQTSAHFTPEQHVDQVEHLLAALAQQ